jgi:hypothetical protein
MGGRMPAKVYRISIDLVEIIATGNKNATKAIYIE